MTANDGFEGLLIASITAVAKLVLVSSVGVFAGLFPRGKPLLHKGALADLSALMVNVAWPAWAFYAVGGSIRLEELPSALWLLPWCAFHCLISLVLGVCAAKLVRIEAGLRPAFVAACGFGNSAAVPILLLETLCQNEALRHIDDCAGRGTGYTMLYCLMWTMLWFCIGLPLLESTSATSGTKETSQTSSDVEQEPSKGLEATQHSSTEASVVKNVGKESLGLKLLGLLWKSLTMPAMLATFLGLLVAVLPSVQRVLFKDDGVFRVVGSTVQTLAAPSVACFTMIMAASLVPSEELRARCKASGWLVRPSSVVALIVVRLMLVPAICFTAWYGVEKLLVGHSSRQKGQLVPLVTLIQCSTPAANMTVVFLAKLQKHDAGTRLAFLYIFMYPVAALTMTGFSTLALQLVFR